MVRNYVLPANSNRTLKMKIDPVNKIGNWSRFSILHRITIKRSPLYRSMWLLALACCWILSSYQSCVLNPNPMEVRNYFLPLHQHHILKKKNNKFSKFERTSEFPILHRIVRGRSFLYRTLWALALIFCWTLSIYQVWDRVMYYFSEPIWTSVTVVRNHTIYYPSMTGCILTIETKEIMRLRNEFAYRHRLNPCYYSGIYFFSPDHGLQHEMNYTSFTQSALLENDLGSYCKLDLESFIRMTDSLKCAKRHHVNVLLSCFTVIPRTPVAFNRRFSPGIYWKSEHDICQDFKDDRTIMVLIHDPLFDDLWLQWNYVIAEDIMKLFYKKATNIVISLSAIKFSYLNTSSNPCVDDETYLKCFRKHIDTTMKNAKITCTLPGFGRRELNVCQNFSSAFVTFTEIQAILPESKLSCPRRCQETIYRKGTEQIAQDGSKFIVSVTFLDNIVDLSEEFYGYSLVALLCDIGGNVGLFLGVSLVSLFEIAEAFCVQCIKCKKRKSSEKNF